MKDTLQLSFLTDLNKTVHFQIPNPKQPIDATAVGAAMDAIVAADIFAFPTGASSRRCKRSSTQRTAAPLRFPKSGCNRGKVVAVAAATLPFWLSCLHNAL